MNIENQAQNGAKERECFLQEKKENQVDEENQMVPKFSAKIYGESENNFINI